MYALAAISGGKDQTLARLESGEVLGWGGAGSGRIRSVYTDICSSTRNTETKPVYIAQLTRWTDVSAGFGASLGLSDRGQVWIWGLSQIAIGGKTRFTEAPVCIDEIQNASKLAAGQFLYAAIDETGKVYSWGFNTDGALGRPSQQINSPPGQVELPATKNIVIGDQFMLALSAEGELYTWGSNSAGQLGLGHLDSVAQPELVRISARIVNIASGSTHALALSADGEVYGWGSNHYGQLADHPKNAKTKHAYIAKPARISIPEKIASIAAGMHCSIALSSSGNVYTWGWNGCGQLGHGDLQSRSKPTRIAGLSGVRAIASGEMHMLALGQKRLLGWGSNESGQLGTAAVRQMTPYSILDS